MKMTKIDSLLKKVELFEKLATGSRKSFLQSIAQDANLEDYDKRNQGSTILPETTIQGTRPVSVPKSVQMALNVINKSRDIYDAAHIEEDGVLGPQTRTALDNFKKQYNRQGMDDKQLFAAILAQLAGTDNAKPSQSTTPQLPQMTPFSPKL